MRTCGGQSRRWATTTHLLRGPVLKRAGLNAHASDDYRRARRARRRGRKRATDELSVQPRARAQVRGARARASDKRAEDDEVPNFAHVADERATLSDDDVARGQHVALEPPVDAEQPIIRDSRAAAAQAACLADTHLRLVLDEKSRKDGTNILHFAGASVTV